MTQPNIPADLTCPHCAQMHNIPLGQGSAHAGQTINCIECGKQFTVLSAKIATLSPIDGINPGTQTLPLEYGGYSQPDKKATSMRWARLIVFGIGLFLAGALFSSLLIPATGRQRAQALHAICTSNLKNIGLACIIYSNNQKDHSFPDSYEALIKDQELTPELFVCPAGRESPSPSTNPSAISADFARGGYCSYIYVGKGMTANSPLTNVLAYERISNHGNKGMNVLYLDGHLQWLDRLAAQKLIAQLQSGPQPGVTTAPALGQ